MTDTAENIPTTLDRLTIPITQLTPRKGNPRQGNTGVIAESLQKNGQYRPIVVNKPTGEVLAGNHTLAAAKQLGWTRIAVTFVDVDDDQAARIVLADNRTADLGTYDDELLIDLLHQLDSDLEGTGYHAADVEALEALGAGGVRDLDDLADEVGELSDAEMWPTIRFQAPPHVHIAWTEHLRRFDSEADGLAALLNIDGA